MWQKCQTEFPRISPELRNQFVLLRWELKQNNLSLTTNKDVYIANKIKSKMAWWRNL